MTRQQQPQRAKASRLALVSGVAIRPKMKGRMMLSAPPGGGKTYTALLIAELLAAAIAAAEEREARILVVDTEKESSLTYADVFRFEQLRWNPPYDPTELALTIREAGEVYDVIIVDSFSHFWRKQGGVLDIAAGDYRGWNQARPVQEDVVEALLSVDAHVIVCCRQKMAHEMVEENGRTKVQKLGLEAQQDADLEYEVNVALEMDMGHTLTVSKSRTNAVPVGTSWLAGHAEDFATGYRDWLDAGEPAADKEVTDNLVAALDRIGDVGERRRAKGDFLNKFGRPEMLLESRVPDAAAWVADRVQGILETPNRAEGDAPADPPAAPPAEANGRKPAAAAPSDDEGTGAPDDADQAAAPGDPAPSPEPEVDPIEAEVTAEVAEMNNSAVSNALREAKLSRNGTAAAQRARLTKHLIDARHQEAATAGA